MHQLWPGQAHFMTIFDLYLTPMTLTFNLPEQMFQMALLFLEGNNCKIILKSMHKCIGYGPYKFNTCSIWPFDLYLTPATLTFNLSKIVSNGSSPPQGQQLCQIVLKSMHYCTSYGPDKCGRTHGRTHIHWTKIVATMSRLPASGLDKKWKFVFSNSQPTYNNTTCMYVQYYINARGLKLVGHKGRHHL